MLLSTKSAPMSRPSIAPSRQRGVVLFVALIILIAMTLGGIALMRSVDTTNLIAGNMSFHQSATLAGEKSTEDAFLAGKILSPGTTAATLNNTGTAGYFPARADPATGASWDTYWNSTLSTNKIELPTDAAGNTVAYVIHRLCDAAGDPLTVNCAKPPNTGGGSNSAGSLSFPNDQVYYRITTRIQGPRNTVAYIQTVVAR